MSTALSLTDVRSGYGRIEVLHGLSLDVPEGAVVALLGRNGMGKTTTLRAIAGSLPVTGGSIELNGRRINGLRSSAIAQRGLVLIPEGRGVFPGLTVRENLQVAHRSGGSSAAPMAEWMQTVEDAFPALIRRIDQSAGSLSGGEQQMLAVCRALVGDPSVIMFDELSMGLAPIIVQSLFERVAALREQGRTILLVEQYLTHALRLADLVYVLQKGKVAWTGTPAELRKSKTAGDLLSA